MSGDMMTVREVGEFFGGSGKPLDPSTIYRWVRQGRLPRPLKIGPGGRSGTRRWRRADLVKLLHKMNEGES